MDRVMSRLEDETEDTGNKTFGGSQSTLTKGKHHKNERARKMKQNTHINRDRKIGRKNKKRKSLTGIATVLWGRNGLFEMMLFCDPINERAHHSDLFTNTTRRHYHYQLTFEEDSLQNSDSSGVTCTRSWSEWLLPTGITSREYFTSFLRHFRMRFTKAATQY